MISELRKGDRADASVSEWFAENLRADLYLSALVLGEIRKGIELLRRRDQLAAEALGRWLEETRTRFCDRIIPIDEAIAEEWGQMSVVDPPPVVDGLMAATARARGLVLVTRNTADVERTGAEFVNPFE